MKPRNVIVEELCAAIEQDRRSVRTIAATAGVSYVTLFMWLNGKIRDPRIETIAKVAKALHMRVVFVDDHWSLEPMAAPAPPAKRRVPRMASWLHQH